MATGDAIMGKDDGCRARGGKRGWRVGARRVRGLGRLPPVASHVLAACRMDPGRADRRVGRQGWGKSAHGASEKTSTLGLFGPSPVCAAALAFLGFYHLRLPLHGKKFLV